MESLRDTAGAFPFGGGNGGLAPGFGGRDGFGSGFLGGIYVPYRCTFNGDCPPRIGALA